MQKKNPVGIELFSHVKTFFYSKQFAKLLTMRQKTIYIFLEKRLPGQLVSEAVFFFSMSRFLKNVSITLVLESCVAETG